MNAMHLLTGPLAQAIGWALLHLLWQATLVAGILAAVLALMPRQSAKARYAASCGALALVFALFVATAVRTYDPAVAPIEPAPVTSNETEPAKISVTNVPVVLAAIAAETWRDRLLVWVATTRQSLPAIVAIWLMGVLFLSSRLMVSWMRARRLTQRNAVEASIEWQRVAARISKALGLRRAVALLQSAAVEVPSVIGSLKPVILLPASTLTGLTPEQIEMVLAHELAHIRRHDFLVNLLQAVVETIMFYHPAVWWMSRRVREERENCCDDLAVAVCGNPIQYARALTRLEELRSAPSLLIAANGGSLLDRIRRIAGGRAESNTGSARWAAAMITLVVLAIGVGIPSMPAFAQREDKQEKVDKVKQGEPAQIEVDVTAAEEPEEAEEAAPEDLAVAMAMDLDIDYGVNVPEPPEPPVLAIDVTPMIAPRALAYADAMVHPTPAPPAVAPMPAIAGVPTPRPARAPRVPHPPAHLAALDFAFDDDDDDDDRRAGKGKSSKKIGSGEKLTVDELISLKAVGVTPEYIDAMRAVFPDLTVGDASSLRALGVTAEYVRDMRAAGIDVTSPGSASGLRALGVSAEYIRAIRAAGVEVKTAREAQSLKAVGVSADFVKQLHAAGYTNLSIKDLTRMAAAGVDEDFIREMSKYRDKK